MKNRILTLSLFMGIVQLCAAQFSVDPAQPLNVCSTSNSIENIQTISGSNGDYFVFWLDKRNASANHLYGQRYNSNGVAQWTANGKSIVAPAVKTVGGYHCIAFGGGILLSWVQSTVSGYGDSVMCKKINYSGNDVWAQPTLIAESGGSILGHETYSLKTIANDSGAFINYSAVYIGGSTGPQFNRIDFNGVKQWATPKTASLPGYVFFTYEGEQNTFYSLSRGNGLGSGIYIQKFNMQSNPQWAAAVDVSQGINTNGFGGNHYLFPDANGNTYITWQTNSNRVYLTKLSSSGSFVWGQPSIAATAISSSQSSIHAVYNNNILYVVWNDDRIANQTTVFTQKFNASGVAQWATDGVQTGIINGYYGYPKLALSDSNAVFCAFLSGVPWQVNAQRIRSNGALTWPAGKLMATNNAFINYNNIVAVSDTNGCNALFWEDQPTEDLFGAKICSNGNLVNITSLQSQQSSITVSPNPAHGHFKITFDNTMVSAKNLAVSVINVHGKKVWTNNKVTQTELDVDIAKWSSGIYFVKCETGQNTVIKKLVVQ